MRFRLLLLVQTLLLWIVGVGPLLLFADTRAIATSRAPRLPPPPVVETELLGSLELRVEAAGAKGIAGASVRAFWERGRRYFDAGHGTTDGDGALRLTRLPAGRLWLLAEAKGFARRSSQILMAEGPQRLRLELEPEQSLRVSVSDEHHAPLAGATVLVNSADPLPFGALTNGAGLAELGRLGRAPFVVKASAPGYESVSQSGVVGAVSLSLRRLGSLLVHVRTGDGKAVPAATLSIGGSTLWPARSAQADAQGDCQIAGLLAGSYDLRAQSGSLVSRVRVGFELGRGERGELTLLVEPGRMVSALVTDDATPSPHLVADADVVLAEEGLSTFPLRGRTGSDGKVTLGPISLGPATLSANAAAFVSSGLVSVPDVLTDAVNIVLPRGGLLSGDVTDARGYPVSGASVEVIGSDAMGLPIAETPESLRFRRAHFAWSVSGPPPLIAAGELGVMPGAIPPIPGSHAALSALALANSQAEAETPITPWITDGSGVFRAAPVSPGRVRALVRHPDFVEAVSEAVTLGPGGEARVKLVLLRGGGLEGRVLDEQGRAVENAEVEVLAAHGTVQRVTTTASDGSFAFSALPADITLSVKRAETPDQVARRLPLAVAEGERKTIEVTLPALREAVSLSVMAGERPLELAEVSVLSLEPESPLRRTLFTGADGEATLAAARGLEVRVSAQAPGFARRVLLVKLGEKLVISLEQGVLVRGRVTTRGGRTAVAGAEVVLSADSRKTARSDLDGYYEFRDVTPGPVRLQARHADYADGALEARVVPTGRVDRPFELPSLDLSEPGELEGEVVDERGQPVVGARVALGSVPSFLPVGSLPRGVAITNAAGEFSLHGLPPGRARVEASSAEYGRGSLSVEVQANRTARGLRIVLGGASSEEEPFAPGGVAITLGERGAGSALEVVIVSVAENSEAERAGILGGDVLRAIDGAQPSSMRDARARLGGAVARDVVLTLGRAGDSVRVSVAREALRR